MTTYNWSEYQVRINGVDKNVADLTMDELRVALCHSIDALEEIDAAANVVTERIEAWRKDEAFMEAANARVLDKLKKAGK